MSVVPCMIVYMSKRRAIGPAVSLISVPAFPERARSVPAQTEGPFWDE